jgi:tight adherence protein B
MLLLYAALIVLLIAVVLFTVSTGEQLTNWWNAKTHKYASWMAIEFESMFQDITIPRAQKWISWAVLGGFLLGVLAGGTVASRLVIGAAFAAFAYFIPRFFVMFLRYRRLETIDNQLVDTLMLMSNALKAGLSLQQALELVVREMKPPIADEFGRLVKEIHLGVLTDDALRHLRDRVPLEDIRLAVESILTLRETGGNLSETFEVIARTIVERKKVQGKIKALTAQGMAQGIVICAMPLGLLLMFTLVDESYMAPMFNTALGWMMLAGIFILDGVGLWMMFKLVKVDV